MWTAQKQISGSPGEGLGGGELAVSSTILGQPQRNIRCRSLDGAICHGSFKVDESVTLFKQQALKLLQRPLVTEDQHGHSLAIHTKMYLMK